MKLRSRTVPVILAGAAVCMWAAVTHAQVPYYVSVHTNTRSDTLVQGVLNWLSFKVDSAGSEPIAGITWPISFTYSNGSLIGPVYDTGSHPNVGFVPWPGGLDSVSFWHSEPAGSADTMVVGLRGGGAPHWSDTGEQWRVSFAPADTGQIEVDTVAGGSGMELSAVDSNGVAHPIVWTPSTLTVAPFCPSGDLNGDGKVDGTDVYILVRYVQFGGPPPSVCLAHADVNCDGQITQGDIIYEIHYVYHGDRPLGYTCSPQVQAWWGCQ